MSSLSTPLTDSNVTTYLLQCLIEEESNLVKRAKQVDKCRETYSVFAERVRALRQIGNLWDVGVDEEHQKGLEKKVTE